MLIPITFPSTSPSNPKLPPALAKISNDEVVLIELQGKLEIEPGREKDRDGKLVGKFKIDEGLVGLWLACNSILLQQSKPTLIIGHHLLEGKVVALPKPLAVLHRRRRTTEPNNAIDESQMMDVDVIAEDDVGNTSSSEATVIWEAIAIVKRKVIFSKRPMPIVGRPKT